MFDKVVLIILACLLFIGCSLPSQQRTYKDVLRENDFAAERYSTQFIFEMKKECPNILRDIESLKSKLSAAERSGSDNVHKKILGEIKWLERWDNILRCKETISTPQQSQKNEDKPVTVETKPITEQGAVSENLQNTPTKKEEKETETGRGVGLSFDECFKKCKELTTRTNEECFDVCIRR